MILKEKEENKKTINEIKEKTQKLLERNMTNCSSQVY